MNKKELLEFAVIGIQSTMDKKHIAILKGEEYLSRLDRNEQIETQMTYHEIKQRIATLRYELKELLDKKISYEFDLSLLDCDNCK